MDIVQRAAQHLAQHVVAGLVVPGHPILHLHLILHQGEDRVVAVVVLKET